MRPFLLEGLSSSFPLPPLGGDEEVRTPDPLRARQVLSQLSYTPMWKLSLPGRRQNFFSHFRFEGTGFAPSKLNNDYAANPD